MKAASLLLLVSAGLPLTGFAASTAGAPPIKLMVLDPGHFHAGLLQKTMYQQIDPMVFVYAPDGPDVVDHLKRVDGYNQRVDKPTHWQATVYRGPDYLERLLKEKPGNAVVMSGNNRGKPGRIKTLVEAGIHVFADKPVIIDPAGFETLRQAFAAAQQKDVVLYDIMTERSEITTMLQRELAQMPDLFGQLETGTPDNPAVLMESVHFFYKSVSGVALKRPAWFFDVAQQGEGMVDVGSHLVDLVQWECFPEKVVDYAKDIQVLSARHWSTPMTAAQFATVTGLGTFPEFLKGSVQGPVLNVYANGEMNYRIKGVQVRLTAKWNYEAPKGSGDTHYSILRGTKCHLVIRQGPNENYQPTLYIEGAPDTDPASLIKALDGAVFRLQSRHPGVDIKPLARSWQIVIPSKYDDGHEAHFAEVTERFLKYIATGEMPAWEVPNMIAKYYTTTKALELARQGK